MANFVIITPAHNEEAFIEQTIHSMIQQTVRPLKWVIVNDASTDRTANIAEKYAREHPFIKLVSRKRDGGRDFGKKVHAFNRGLEEICNLPYEFIGNLDADITFEPHYFESILREFEADSKLGIGGGIVYTRFTNSFVTYDNTLDSVGGKVQLFRRECFEVIGGYRPLKFGGIDATAEIMARMKGWKVRKSLQNRVSEHRPTGFAYGQPLAAMMHDGRKFHSLGYDPIFYLFRCMYRVPDYPFLLGSGAAFIGYLCSMIRRDAIVLPAEVVSYLRSEQRAKLKRALRFLSTTKQLCSLS